MSAWVVPVLGLAWILFAVAVLLWGTAFFRRWLGEEACLPQGSFFPWLMLSGTVAVSLVWWFRSRESLALTLALAIPILVAALWALRLRFAEGAARKQEFGWRDERLVRIADGSPLFPTFAKHAAAYSCTGPASGYCLYSVELFDDRGLIARNGYLHENAVRRDVDRLARATCRFLDAQVVWQASPTVLYSHHLNPWSELLCGRPHTMPEDANRFWQQWVRPIFPAEGSAEVATAELRAHLAPMLEVEPEEGERLQRLLDLAGPSVRIMSERARRNLEAGIRGPTGRSILEFENGIAKVTLLPGN